jgi:hypothetical protein
MHRLLCLFLLAGCPAQSRYITADVTAARVPLNGALVAADCGVARPAQRTDEDGRARLRVYDEAHECSLLVAKPGYPTVVTGPVDVCPAGACPPTRIDLSTPREFVPMPVRESATSTSRRPLEVAR